MRSEPYARREYRAPPPTPWRRWWAWYPVSVSIGGGARVTVWREYVEWRCVFGRRGMGICGLEIETTIEYRLSEEK